MRDRISSPTGRRAPALAIGQLRHQTRLGSQAIYRVCGFDDTFATVAVVGAPGLLPGQTFRLARASVAGMAVATTDGTVPAP